MARSSAASGRLARNPAYDVPWAHGAIASPSSACTIISEPEPRGLGHRRGEPGGVEVRELLDPRVEQEALEAEDAGVVQRRQVGHVAGHGPAPEADVDADLVAGHGPLLARAPPTVVVGGMLLSGMSTIVVTPPAAAARVALAKPSHSVRPGSLTCTCVSTSPGSSTSSSASTTTVRAAARRRRTATRAVITPSRIRTATAVSRSVDDRTAGAEEGRQLPR